MSYSDIEGGEEGVHLDEYGVLNWGNGNIDADPLFADPDSGDYHLTAESPCIDTGDPESPLDPDGTHTDMGAFYFHQRDIDVQPTEVHFPAIPWGETDSTLVLIQNVGRTNLHISAIAPANQVTCIWMRPVGLFDPPLEMAPDSTMALWFFFRPDRLPNSTSCVVFSDDPDEPEVYIFADAEFVVVDENDTVLPGSFGITGVHPNPFNSAAVAGYELRVASRIRLGLYDLNGRLTQDLFDGKQGAGRHQAVINGALLPTGVYWLSLGEQGGQQSVAKVVLVR